MNNSCVFSPDRHYRYSLVHRWDEMFNPELGLAWLCLNPSTADQFRLDPTLTRIRDFSAAWGYSFFVMLNLFAWRATDPNAMKRVEDPIGPENDDRIRYWAARCDRVVLGWGEHGAHRGRDRAVLAYLDPGKLYCLDHNVSGQPKHPLYVSKHTQLKAFRASLSASS